MASLRVLVSQGRATVEMKIDLRALVRISVILSSEPLCKFFKVNSKHLASIEILMTTHQSSSLIWQLWNLYHLYLHRFEVCRRTGPWVRRPREGARTDHLGRRMEVVLRHDRVPWPVVPVTRMGGLSTKGWWRKHLPSSCHNGHIRDWMSTFNPPSLKSKNM